VVEDILMLLPLEGAMGGVFDVPLPLISILGFNERVLLATLRLDPMLPRVRDDPPLPRFFFDKIDGIGDARPASTSDTTTDGTT
jgi:hypothetical protein